MAVDVTLPALGEGTSRGTLIRWLKQIGDRVDVGDPLFEISTDKIDAEVEAQTSGVLIEIIRHVGEEIRVGECVGRIGTADEWREISPPRRPIRPVESHETLLGATLHSNPPMFLDELDGPIPDRVYGPQIAIISESARDEALVDAAVTELERLELDHERHQLRPRDPSRIRGFAALTPERPLRVIIVCGGDGGHLAATLAAETRLPVIAVPRLDPDGGLAGLLGAAHAPSGVAVATVAPGPRGARQAAVFATRILAAFDPALARRVLIDLHGPDGGGSSGELF